MGKILRVLSIIANVAIISGLIKDTFEKVNFRREKTTATDLEYEQQEI